MPESKTERDSCRFAVELATSGPRIILQTFHQSISLLKDAVIGFDLLGGTTEEQAKKVADVLNERVLDLFVSVTK